MGAIAKVLFAVVKMTYVVMMVGVMGFLVFEAPVAGLHWLTEEGYVRLPAAPAEVDLTGAPGDQIKMRLLHDVWPPIVEERSEFFLELRDQESGFETSAPIRLEVGGEEGNENLYGRFIVPQIPGHRIGAFSGRLRGQAALGHGFSSRLDIPVHLRVVARGEAAASGSVDLTWRRRAAVLVLGLAALSALTAYLHRRVSARTVTPRGNRGPGRRPGIVKPRDRQLP